MRNLKGYILSIVFSLLAVLPAAAIEDTVDADSVTLDSLSISIITCTPGKDLYAKFGHTAIRVVDYTIGEDAAFNYGSRTLCSTTAASTTTPTTSSTSSCSDRQTTCSNAKTSTT